MILAITPNEKFNQAVKVLLKLDKDKSIIYIDKIYCFTTIYLKWGYENIEKWVEKSELLDYQH